MNCFEVPGKYMYDHEDAKHSLIQKTFKYTVAVFSYEDIYN